LREEMKRLSEEIRQAEAKEDKRGLARLQRKFVEVGRGGGF